MRKRSATALVTGLPLAPVVLFFDRSALTPRRPSVLQAIAGPSIPAIYRLNPGSAPTPLRVARHPADDGSFSPDRIVRTGHFGVTTTFGKSLQTLSGRKQKFSKA